MAESRHATNTKREEGHTAINENERSGGTEDCHRYVEKNLYSLKTGCSPPLFLQRKLTIIAVFT